MRQHLQTIIEVQYDGGARHALVWSGSNGGSVLVRTGELLAPAEDADWLFFAMDRAVNEGEAALISINDGLAERLFKH